ncbi:autotransporter domain-containing protein [Moraxella sp. ZY200743]|uniref:autotransporter domain-containing protein n=1 Tax=Moraxella sp. ZY200743 TaxID=2911970 RepID=UPI003D7DA5BA
MKKSTLLKQSALGLTISLALSTHAQPYSQVIVFGDSLSDTGNFAKQINDNGLIGLIFNTKAQPSFTTNPDTTWAGVLAHSYGHTAEPNDNQTLTGTNYAVGGARAEFEVVQPLGIATSPSVKQQIDSYFNKHDKADPKALYAVWIGANDLLEASDKKHSILDSIKILQDAAQSEIQSVKRLSDSGAKQILVPNLPDVSLTPRMINDPNKASATIAAQYYNSTLYTGLNQSDANVIPANTFALLQEAVSNKEAFGFKHTDTYGCKPIHPQLPSSLISVTCDQSSWQTPTANEDFAFADEIHPSGRTHSILAQYYRSIIDAPTQVSKLPQQILNTGTINNEHLSRRLNRLNGQKHGIWVDALAGSNGSLTTGLDIAGERSHTGAYLNHQNQDYALSNTLSAEAKNIGVGVYHRHVFNNLYLGMNAGIDRLTVNTNRRIAWKGEARQHSANAAARRFHAGMQAGYNISLDKASIRPYIGVNTQKVALNALTEDQLALSTAMRFHKQDINSLQGKVGIDMDYVITPKVTFTGGVSHTHEFKENDRVINAALTSVPEYAKGFNTTVVGDKVHATSATLGLKGQIGRTQIGVGAYATHLDGKHGTDTNTGGFISTAWAF